MNSLKLVFVFVISFEYTLGFRAKRADDQPKVIFTSNPVYEAWSPGQDVTFICRAVNTNGRDVKLSLWVTRSIHNKDELIADGATNELKKEDSVFLQNHTRFLYCLGEYVIGNTTRIVRSPNKIEYAPRNYFYDSNEIQEIIGGRQARGLVITNSDWEALPRSVGDEMYQTCVAGANSVPEGSDKPYTLTWMQQKGNIVTVLNTGTFKATGKLSDAKLPLVKKVEESDNHSTVYCELTWNEGYYSATKLKSKSRETRIELHK